ncbi:formylglycine-generating enzyme family protein [Orrella daihaiensis]|uniref:Formylglycine-generating enzyme family protein n=1 Tax=Orrella daihaiensis TaxID=2782176 RepID=A0ABY4ALA9_9BURK|nr:formylglycine-generating enzyme family protein [Orrella daihaiensis]UOD51091.1 formylglycine-generating enzyme family protein [Orrella daihaiensis]
MKQVQFLASLPVKLALSVMTVSAAMPAAAQSERLPIGQPVAFWIDSTEVTVGDFARFAQQNNLQTAAERDGGGYEYRFGWQQREGWNFRSPYGKPAKDQEPAVHVSWFEADQYCKSNGGRLPTRDQWAQAAYQETRANPPEPFVTAKSYEFPTGESSKNANTVGDGDGWSEHAPVASFPPGVNGLYDMGANVWEWLADARGDDRLTAGGSWWYGPSKMTERAMQYKPGNFYAVYVGFRCVYDRAN